jgi:hypothetical protein
MVKFFYKEVQNKMESQKQNRPVFKEKLYIEIRIAGQRDVQACRPATHADKQRFPRHLDAFERRVEAPTEGMPLVEWPKITRSQAEELSFNNVKTVEQLASMKDSNLSKMMNGYSLRDAAVKWLELNSAETVDREKEEMRAELAELRSIVQGLTNDESAKRAVELESPLDEPEEAPAPRSRKTRAKPKT